MSVRFPPSPLVAHSLSPLARYDAALATASMAHTGLAIRTRRAKPDSMDGGVILVPDSPVHKQPAEAEPQVKTKKKPRKKKKETAEQQVADGPPVHNQPPEAEPPTKTKKKQKAKKEKDEQAADGLPVGFNGRFTSEYGASFDELEPWVRLCRDLGVDRPLPSKTQCRKVTLSQSPPHTGQLSRSSPTSTN